MNSLDPRVTRLEEVGDQFTSKEPLDQFGTYEVFVQPKQDKPFQHEGALHAPNLEMAFVLAKEAYTRRFQCVSLCVVKTSDVLVSATTEGNISVYDQPADPPTLGDKTERFEIYHLQKRGKQHVHAGSVEASGLQQAWVEARANLNPGKPVYNVWAIPSSKFRFTTQEEKDLWNTLPDKKFRDASDYKGGDKLKDFLANHKS